MPEVFSLIGQISKYARPRWRVRPPRSAARSGEPLQALRRRIRRIIPKYARDSNTAPGEDGNDGEQADVELRASSKRPGSTRHSRSIADRPGAIVAETVDFKYRAFLSYAHTDTRWAKWLHGARRLLDRQGYRWPRDADRSGAEDAAPHLPRPRRFLRRPCAQRRHHRGARRLGRADRAVLAGGGLEPRRDEEVRLFRRAIPPAPSFPSSSPASRAPLPLPACGERAGEGLQQTPEQAAAPHPDPLSIEGMGRGGSPRGERRMLPARAALRDRRRRDYQQSPTHPPRPRPARVRRRPRASASPGRSRPHRPRPRRPLPPRRRARRRQSRLRATIAATFLAIIAGGGFFAWQNWQRQQHAAEIEALVARYSPTVEAQAASPGAGQSLKEAITSIVQGAASDPRYREALDLLKAGKPKEAEPLLTAVAEDKKKRAQQNAKEAAAAYRNLAAIKRVSDPRSAREAYAEAAALDPEHVEGLFRHGWLQREAGNLRRRRMLFGACLRSRRLAPTTRGTLGAPGAWRRRGCARRPGIATKTYREALVSVERLAKAEPEALGWQRGLLVSYKIGDVLKTQGSLDGALAIYQASLVIAKTLSDGSLTLPSRTTRSATSCETKAIWLMRWSPYQASLAIDERLSVFAGSSPITFTSPSSQACQKSGPFAPLALPSLDAHTTLSDSRHGRCLSQR